MKRLLSNPRMLVEDIAKETSLSTKTVARRLEKLMIENHILQFTIFTNASPIFYAINRVYRIRSINWRWCLLSLKYSSENIQWNAGIYTASSWWCRTIPNQLFNCLSKETCYCIFLFCKHFYSQPNIKKTKIVWRG